MGGVEAIDAGGAGVTDSLFDRTGINEGDVPGNKMRQGLPAFLQINSIVNSGRVLEGFQQVLESDGFWKNKPGRLHYPCKGRAGQRPSTQTSVASQRLRLVQPQPGARHLPKPKRALASNIGRPSGCTQAPQAAALAS